MIEVKNIACGYKKGIDVIKDCNFSLEQGEVLVLLGKNGAGKSTILKAILGLIKLNDGEILIDGVNIKDLNIKQKAKLISYVPQNVSLPPLSVKDTVLSSRLSYYLFNPSDKDLEVVDKVINDLGLNVIKDKDASTTSGGEAQLVAIARSLAQEPKFIVFDEPSSNLDILNISLLEKMIKKIKNAGIGCIIALHDLNMAYKLGDKFLFLKDGNTIAFGDKSVFCKENVSNAYSKHINIKKIENNLIINIKEKDND